MDFDSSLFDLPFEDLASLSVENYQQQAYTAPASPMVDFQDFCSDFASSDFASSDFGAQVSETTASAWTFETSIAPQRQLAQIDVPPVKEPLWDGLDKDTFDFLGPCDDSLQDTLSYSTGGEAQVVPDMAPGQAAATDFLLPSFPQSYVSVNGTSVPQASTTKPYTWMNGMDYASFGWPARTRLPSDPAARQQSLERYRDKKARRFNNSTKVRYEMRKVNADKRPRIKGRFVKPEELQSYLKSIPEDLA